MPSRVSAQDLAVRTNLLFWATASPNVALEFATGERTTFVLDGSYNPFEFSDGKKLKHWRFQPEFRFWTCDTFNGHFFGIHGIGGQFNVAGIDMPFGMWPELKENRYQGWTVGGGVSYGYHWMLNRRWSLELSVGVGYLYVDYEKFPCAECGTSLGRGTHHYFGPTKAAINLVYIIK